MPQPRKRLVSLDDTPYYHCISRCVRRAFLCGRDSVSGYDFEHRRQWIVDRIKLLCRVFAVELCAYAVMSNHYHIVVRIEVDRARSWSDQEVAERWTRLFHRPDAIHRYLGHDILSEFELEHARQLIATWRRRLHDLSWFMRCLNEPIARMANREDRCTGRFWEGRFISQALLDERALLACMAYVDLNPIRAGMADTPEASDFTSIQERIRQPASAELRSFAASSADEKVIPISLKDYLEMVDWAGRAIRVGNKGSISTLQPPVLSRLNMRADPLIGYLRHEEAYTPVALGSMRLMRSFARAVGRRFIKGLSLGNSLCPDSG